MRGAAARGLAAAALAAALAAGGSAAAADVFSPGELSRAHAKLAGLENCTKCHPKGEQLSQARCLECHTELAPRVAAGRGYHGRLPAGERDCWTCHHEHQGPAAPLVEWGEGGPRRFDHARTGAPLGGKHARVACERCHDPRLVADPAVRELLAKAPGRRTYLGAPAPSACARCHFDDHRGQLGQDCGRCHSDAGWKPAGGFDHARTAYPLTGLHARVACARCHAEVKEPAPEHGALTAPVSPASFRRYRPVAHAACLDCHRDVHEGRFGTLCTQCHTTVGWKAISGPAALGGREGAPGAAQRAFHDRTRYPLQGAHAAVACAACHGPFRGEPARFKGLAFGACTDCHADAHVGQLAARPEPARAGASARPAAAAHPERSAGGAESKAGGAEARRACERCHTVQGWLPPRFGPEEHARTAYPLAGAHRAVACAACHPHDLRTADAMPAAVRAELARRGRPARVSPAVLRIAGDLSRCETCHLDAHGGQLSRPAGCAACHEVSSFRKVRFDHAVDSRFPLTGKHAAARCATCHPREHDAAGALVRYRPLDTACAACHADPHAGQFAAAARSPDPAQRRLDEARGDCARCHDTGGWKATRFRHAAPFTDYALTGKHEKVACEKCHPAVDVGGGVRVRRYRPTPRGCAACHADFHKGAFRGFEPARFGR